MFRRSCESFLRTSRHLKSSRPSLEAVNVGQKLRLYRPTHFSAPSAVGAHRYFCANSKASDSSSSSSSAGKKGETSAQSLEELIKEIASEKELPGTRAEDAYAIAYTCGKCNGRSAKKISKRAYHHGVVIITCPFCKNRHLIADRLGWFEEGGTDIEKMMKEKGEEVRTGVFGFGGTREDADRVMQELVDMDEFEDPKQLS
eukprot:TRINITY_DN97402_c0_g1_i1.p1 TRINITY_DN97402_c0_g1~~TRINITY_DN97402_c0_g1_i1.p1  ORF type:complete len:223 (-),score=46.24 TRINITY_DN97402_c0_g1_i1:32-634(-)